MQRPEVLAVVRDVAQRLLDVDPAQVHEATSFVEDLAVDSLALVEYAMALEDELQVRLAEDDLAATRTVGQLVDLLSSRVAA
jgi:acyl carrier protein